MFTYATATEAENPGRYRERLEAESLAQRQQMRLGIVRLIVNSLGGVAQTPAEVVSTAKTIEAFVVGEEAQPATEELVRRDGISADVRRRRDLLAAAKAIEDGLANAGVSLVDELNGGTTWQQRDAPARGFVSRAYSAGGA